MNINAMPENLNQWKSFQHSYETKYMGYSEYGHQLACHSLNELCKQAVPTGFKFIAKQLLLGTVDEKIRDCLKLPKPIIPPKILLTLIHRFQPKRDIVNA